MGNGSSAGSSAVNTVVMSKRWRGRSKPRVVLESPQESKTDNTTKPTRVTFADKRSGATKFNERPQMTDIGKVSSDIQSRKVIYTRGQTMGGGLTTSTNTQTSLTSIRSTGSGPVDGIWDPTLNPYSFNEREANMFYSGFEPRRSTTRKSGFMAISEF